MSVAEITDEFRQLQRLTVHAIVLCQRLEKVEQQLNERQEMYEEQDNQLRHLQGLPARATPPIGSDDEHYFSDSLG